MFKVLTVAWREFLDTVRTKMFFISLVLVPGIIVLMVFGTQRVAELTESETIPTREIAVVDETNMVLGHLEQQVAAHNEQNPNRPLALREAPAVDREALTNLVNTGDAYAYVRIPAGVMEVDPAQQEPAAVELGRRDQQLQALRELDRMLNRAIQQARFLEAEIDPARVMLLQQDVPIEAVDVRSGEAREENLLVRLLAPFAFMFLLFMGTMQVSYGLLTSLLEEKSSRVMEVILSAVSPLQLMAGKILGVVFVGLLLLAVWGGVGYYSAQSRGYGGVVSAQLLFYLFLYFVPAFLMMSAFLGAVGSACNTIKEAQTMASPLTIFNIVPLILWFPISQNPQSVLSVALSFVPPITPFIMILRVCADPDTPVWQIVVTLAILWATVLLLIWGAAKIFRVGVLMYGKPPTPRELVRWLRYA